MRRKRTVPLLVFVALIASAFAVPAAASAAYWTHQGNGLEEAAEINFSGAVEASLPYLGIACDDVQGTLALSPGDQGEITDIDYSECHGSVGSINGLQFTSTPNNLPWPVEIKMNGQEAMIHTDDVSVTLKESYGGKVTWNSTWELIPDNQEEMGSLEVEGFNKWCTCSETGGFDLSPAGWLGIEQ